MKLNLLPSIFRILGLVLILTAILSQVIFSLQHVEVLHTWRMKLFTFPLIIGCLFILISKGKKEDELSENLRHSSIACGFVTTLFLYLVNESHLLHFIGLHPQAMGTFGFIIAVLLFSIGYYYMMRYNMVKREK